jgi:CO/xanthine dehydrogenase FAD-binding subunit
MDLPNIETCLRPSKLADVSNWDQVSAWLAGGTWLFSEPQLNLKVLIDMQSLGWSEIEVVKDYLAIGATCPLVKLLQYPWLPEWTAVDSLKSAVSALAASLKVINVATVEVIFVLPYLWERLLL